MVWIKPVSQSTNPDLSSSRILINTVPAIARASWCSLWQENSTVGLRSLQGNCSQGGVRSFCLSTPSTSTSSITWKSWGYLSGESQASSSGLREKVRNIWWENLHFEIHYCCLHIRDSRTGWTLTWWYQGQWSQCGTGSGKSVCWSPKSITNESISTE